MVAEDYKRQLSALQEDMENTIRERDSTQVAEIADLQDEFQQKLRAAEQEHKVLESGTAELQEREQQALLDQLKATERRFRVQLERREEELSDMEESLRLMREEAASQGSAGRQKAKQELVKHEKELADKRQGVRKGQTAFNNLQSTTKDLRQGIVSGIAGRVTTALLTGGM